MVKKIVSLVLCFCITFNYLGPSCFALAEELTDQPQEVELNQEEKKEDLQQEEEQEENKKEEKNIITHREAFDAKGNLEIDLKFVLPIRNVSNSNIGLYLYDKNGSKVGIDLNGILEPTTKNIILGNQNVELSIRKLDENGLPILGTSDQESIMYYGITIYNLDRGTYTVELFGNGYKAYTSEVTLDNYSKRITLSNETGMFEVGDVNQDGRVNDLDIEQLIPYLGTNSIIYDLNRDGIVDIADLNYITATISGTKKNATIVDTTAILDETNITMEGGEGTISDLLTETGSVKITPTNDEEITENNPAEITLKMTESVKTSELRLETGYENIPEQLELIILDENGKEHQFEKNFSLTDTIATFTDKANPNTIVIDLKGQIAIKKVTIRIKKSSSLRLAEIAKVEFLNNVYEEVPTPKMERPTNVKAIAQSESMTVTFDHMPNVTGYEIIVKQMNNDQVVKNTVYQTTYNEFKVSDLKNYTQYRVCVQSVNQEWKSGCSEEITVTPKPTRLPPAVDMVKLTPVYAGFNISYKKMDDTLDYNIYYRKKGDTDYQKIPNVKGTSYSLRKLESNVEYEVQVSGNNDLGEGPKSSTAVGRTKDYIMPDTYNFGLINRPNGTEVTDHIKKVTILSGESTSTYALVDNNYNTYWEANSWDTGGFNVLKKGPIIEFDGFYKLDKTFLIPMDDTASFSYVKVYYYNEAGIEQEVKADISSSTSPNGQKYYKVILEQPIYTNKIQICLANYLANGTIALREMKFYEYNSLEDEVAALFKDDLRIELQDQVTEEMIQTLETRVNTKEEASGEYHPNRSVMLKDLEYARQILNDTAIRSVITVDQKISNDKNSHLGFAMKINDYQPLGVVARPGEKLTIYVGTNNKTLPQVVFTQYYAEANVWTQTVTNLKKGQNIIEVPKIGTMKDERGGSVYLRYPSAKEGAEIKVRVSGGTEIPVLDLHHLTDEEQKKQAIEAYIEKLEQYTTKLPQIYSDQGLTYNAQTSVLNSTEIVTRQGLFSVAATKVIQSINSNLTTMEQKVARVLESTNAFDEMVDMFYRHKGLRENAENEKDKIPSARINIRYMRMFDGAFMYAGGLHIGIGYNSIGGLLQGRTMNNGSFDGYFGWGISHEIGHQINQGSLAYAEVTNNVFALLAQTANDTSKSRLETSNIYPKIYEKVTSNTIGKSSNVFVSLGMYWQLHLAYDDAKTFDDTNSIYAKINHLARTSTLKGSKDDLLVMYASEATGKNLVPFFQKWGLTPSEEAIQYASQFEEEKRAIWFLSDNARRYRLEGGAPMLSGTKVEATLTEADSQNKRFTITFNVTNNQENKILGYEIRRNGESIGFTTKQQFTDQIGAMNNRAITYEVIAYDYLLNATETYVLDEVKVAHDGSIKKGNFTIESNVKANGEIVDLEDETMDESALTVNNLIDGKKDTYFYGTEKIPTLIHNGDKVENKLDTNNAYITIHLNSRMALSGIKYQAALENGTLMNHTISNYNIYVSRDGSNWTLAKTGTFELNEQNDYTEIVYFDKEGTTGGDQLWTYDDISYVKIESVGNKNGLSGAEIDLIAPPGDNVELSNETIGKLKEPFIYDENEEPIKAGSVVFKGDYRGNPAFNAMLLVDSKDENMIYDGENFLFASLNNENDVNEIAHGYWFYVVSEEDYQKMIGTSIRARLYRVNDALTLEGERLTSTSLAVTNLPNYEDLPFMEIVDTTKGTE